MTANAAGPYAPRYKSLDAWRAIAALTVLLHHQLIGRVDLVFHGWLGVQLFFVISGYCMAAATTAAMQAGFGFRTFARRRLRRILPPYLASVVIALFVHVWMRAIGSTWREAAAYLDKPPLFYLQNFSLTQWLTIPVDNAADRFIPAAAQNPSLLLDPYWSLNYEEQLYVICGLALVLVRWTSPLRLLVLITAATALYNLSAPGFISGFFIDYWLQFALGVLVFLRLCRAPAAKVARALDGGLFMVVVASGAAALLRGEFATMSFERHDQYAELFVCAVFAGVLVLLRPFDERIVASGAGRVLCRMGLFSYSLYLFHHSLLEVWAIIEAQLGLPTPRPPVVDAACALFNVAGAWCLSRVFERPFLNRPASAPESVKEPSS